jgi:hypothetical protein
MIFFFERLGRMHETKTFFLMFGLKPGILIPDLYFYGIKIQTHIKKNSVEKYAGKSQTFKKKLNFFGLGWAGPGPKGNEATFYKMKAAQKRTHFLQGWTQPSRLGWTVQPKGTNG